MDAGYVIGASGRPLWRGRVLAALDLVRVSLWRAALCLVIGPAVIAATLWTLAVLFGATSTHQAVQDLYTYADTSFRAAPAGMVRVQTCDDPDSAPTLRNQYGDILGCQHPRMINVPASRVVADQIADLERLYWMLAGLSAFFVLAFYIRQRLDDIVEWFDDLIDSVTRPIRRRIRHAKWVRDGSDGIPPL